MSQKLPHSSAHAGRPGSQPPNAPSSAAAELPADPVAPRIPAAQIPEITGLRLSPHGTDAKLINISTSGLLAECPSRLKVGSTVAVLFEGTFSESSVVGRIARCEVSTMGKDGVLRYHIGIDFNKPIALDQWTQPAEEVKAPAQAASADDTPPRPRPVPVLSPAAAAAPAAVRNRW
jgi:hypothetical protein